MKPYENRTACKYCGKKGYLKIVKNNSTNDIIRKKLNEPKNVMYSFELDPPMLRCLCQNCGEYHNYFVKEGLFADGVIKEI